MENTFQSHNSTFVIVLDVFVFNCDAHPLLDLERRTDRKIGAKRPKLAQKGRNRLNVSYLRPLIQVPVVWAFSGPILNLQEQAEYKELKNEQNLQSVI